jgi:4-hydroxybenzoate polyprenyltransferase
LTLSEKKYNTAFLFALIAIVGFIYTIKMIPLFYKQSIRWISLKDIPIGKNIIVCIIWAGSALAIAATFIDIRSSQIELILLFATFFIGNCNSTITSDARDVIGDKMRDISTLPGMIGLKNTFVILTIINISGISSILFLTMQGIVPIKLATFSLAVILWAGLCTIPQYFWTDKLPKTINELLIDSHLLLSALGLIAVGLL